MKGLAQFLYIGDVDGCIDGFEAAFIAFGRTGRLGDCAATFYDNQAFCSVHAEDWALFAFVIAGDDPDVVAFFDVCLDGAHWKSAFGLENLGSEGNDLHELFFTKLAGDRTEDTGATRVVVLVDKHASVRIEAEDGAIGTADGKSGADDDGLDHGSFFHRGGGNGIADVGGDHVANSGGTCAFSEDANHFSGAGAGVVSNGDFGFHLDHISGVVKGWKIV